MDDMIISSVRADPPPPAVPCSKQYTDGTSNIYALAFGPESARVFLAVGTEARVDVLIRDTNVDDISYKHFKSFYLSSRVTSLAWSHRSFAGTGEYMIWGIELAAACADHQIRFLSASSDEPGSSVVIFGGPLAGGHRARINGLAFCTIADGGLGGLALASVSDDKCCIIWNLEEGPTVWSRIRKSHRLLTVARHPRIASGVLVSSASGEIFEILITGNRAENVSIELAVPAWVAATCAGTRLSREGGAADWKPDDPDVVGAVFGHKWYVWDLNRLYGVTPTSSGDVSTWTGHCFKWSPVHRHLFAIASFDVGIEDTVKIYDTRFPHKPMTPRLPTAGERVSAIDWSWEGPWIAVAKGRTIVFIRTENVA